VARFVVLGSAYAVPDAVHDNTHFILVGAERTLLVDCASNPVVRLSQANVPLESITDLFLTHFHPDHVSGVALLWMGMWLMGRKMPLHVYGLEHALNRTKIMMDLYGWDTWPDFFPIIFHPLDEGERIPVFRCEEFEVTASAVRHFVPTMGLRFDFPLSGKSIAYSCDTEPCPAVVDLARQADYLFHEANAESTDVAELFSGHSSAVQAGETARLAGVKTLLLIHYAANHSDPEILIHQARRVFSGEILLARDFMEIEV
jgi:ribonuclease Z